MWISRWIERYKAMKKVVFLMVLFVASFMVGCDDNAALTASNGAGIADSRQQRRRRLALIMDMQERMLTDDSDEIWFFDTNTKLTQWNVSVGN